MAKQNRTGQTIHLAASGMQFQTGLDLELGEKPIILRFAANGKIVMATNWSPEDAEAIAFGLLKFVTLYRTRYRPQQQPPAPAPALPPAP